jgi:protocatechuate 3,4-dioxygenase, alpha subunit
MGQDKPLLGQTPSQTVGPYFAYGLTSEQYGYPLASIVGPAMVDEATPGQHIRIEGCVYDGRGEPVTDAMIEIWQADSNGQYLTTPGANSRFTGFGRCGTGTDPDAKFWFDTLKPGVANAGDAPHINVTVMMRGLLNHAFTRIYFADESSANEADPVLQTVPADRRGTLLAHLVSTGLYRFDIRMQGDAETVFFDL